MMPIGPLMIEHRLIERMIEAMGKNFFSCFFIPCMEYLSQGEQEAILKEEWEFDKSLIHEKYRNAVIAIEKILIAKKL